MVTKRPPTHAGHAVLAATALSVVLTGCGSSGNGEVMATATSASPAQSPPSTSSATPFPPSTVTSSTPPVNQTEPPASPSSIPPTAAELERCHTASLQTKSVTDVPGEIGQIFTVVLTNVGKATCQTQGWPGVSFVDAAGKDLGDAERVGSAPQAQTLPPGTAVQVTVRLSNPAGGNGCSGGAPSSRTVLLTPPNETDHLTVPLPHTFLVCRPAVYPIGSPAQGA